MLIALQFLSSSLVVVPWSGLGCCGQRRCRWVLCRVVRVAACATPEKTRSIRIRIVLRIPGLAGRGQCRFGTQCKSPRSNHNELSLGAINPRAVARFWPGPARVARCNGGKMAPAALILLLRCLYCYCFCYCLSVCCWFCWVFAEVDVAIEGGS